MERSEELSHGAATGFKPPEGISFNRIAPDKSLASTLLSNELDAAHIASPWVLKANALDRSSRIAGRGDWNKIKPLFPDRMAEGARFYGKHGFLPVNHTYILRGDIYQKHPWAARNLYSAFLEAKALAREKLLERIPAALFFGPEYLTMTRELIGEDPFPYGIKANAGMVDTIASYSYEQGLTSRKMRIEELFAESTLDS
jgi:4,5-dihydroxyphthalate decarboxylase